VGGSRWWGSMSAPSAVRTATWRLAPAGAATAAMRPGGRDAPAAAVSGERDHVRAGPATACSSSAIPASTWRRPRTTLPPRIGPIESSGATSGPSLALSAPTSSSAAPSAVAAQADPACVARVGHMGMVRVGSAAARRRDRTAPALVAGQCEPERASRLTSPNHLDSQAFAFPGPCEPSEPVPPRALRTGSRVASNTEPFFSRRQPTARVGKQKPPRSDPRGLRRFYPELRAFRVLRVPQRRSRACSQRAPSELGERPVGQLSRSLSCPVGREKPRGV